MLRSTIQSLTIAGLCVGGLLTTDSFAQEEVEEGVMQIEMAVDNESGSGPIVISSSSMTFSGNGEGGESNFEIFTGGDIGGWMPGASRMDPMSLLSNEDVREELELVGDQLGKYQDAQKELQEQIKEKSKAFANGKLDPSEMGAIAKEIAQLQKSGQEKLQSMLLPHQMERLRQVALQMEMKRRGAGNTLLSKEMMEELEIDDAQKKRIKAKQEELKKELADGLAKLKEEIREKLLTELTSEQKAKLAEMSGDKFDYKQTSVSDRIREKIEKRMKGRIGG